MGQLVLLRLGDGQRDDRVVRAGEPHARVAAGLCTSRIPVS
jgi:hypothetical protein